RLVDVPAVPVSPPDAAADAVWRAQQGKGYWQRVWARLRQDKVTLAMAAMLALLLVIVIFAPYFTAHDPYDGSALRRLKPVGTPGYWLGPDEGGRDLWARLLYGGGRSPLGRGVPVSSGPLGGGVVSVLPGAGAPA